MSDASSSSPSGRVAVLAELVPRALSQGERPSLGERTPWCERSAAEAVIGIPESSMAARRA